HMQIIFEINKRFLSNAVSYFPMQNDKIAKVSIIEESDPKMVRMANLAIIGSHSTNGVAALHSKLLVENMFPEFAQIYPERFNNKTNGITQRRWLLDSNPGLASLITDAIGKKWITDFDEIKKLNDFAQDPAFLEKFAAVKQEAKVNAAAFLKKDTGIILDPNTMIDVQVKRIHEYKRQLLNALNIVMIYNRMKSDKAYRESFPPTTFLFGGKAAPGYYNAKLIIKFINNIATVINADPQVNKYLHVYFMPDYRVTLAQNVIPATNLSEQISTAGLEASGTGNMKFMCNGALTIGTLDGANVEMAEEVGNDNIFIFGHTESQIKELARTYNARSWAESDPEISAMVKLIESEFFNNGEEGIFKPLLASLFDQNDRYFLFADLRMYHDRHEEASLLYATDTAKWNEMAVKNVAASAKFSSDRTIKQYADEIWNIKPCHVKKSKEDSVLEDARKQD
ncbi:MAG: glycogen/starch/alpha-glucan family phosphorylase, partial [Spirochaetales bacterium]|nr:glycogen/starch/alpha-glucan family phosphorylase [Candidatus Physcosoma equi]